MVTRMSWIPAEGTYRVTDTDDAFNPTIGKTAFYPASAHEVVVAMNAEKEEQFQLGEPPASPMIPEDILEPNKWAKTSVALSKLLDCAALCNLASVFEERDEEEGGTGELTGI